MLASVPDLAFGVATLAECVVRRLPTWPVGSFAVASPLQLYLSRLAAHELVRGAMDRILAVLALMRQQPLRVVRPNLSPGLAGREVKPSETGADCDYNVPTISREPRLSHYRVPL